MEQRLEIGLLGPLVITVDGRSVVPSAAKQRVLLALLSVNLGREVGMGAIVEELWGGCPPNGPAAAVQTYVKHLRHRISQSGDADPKEVVARGYGGYRLGSAMALVDAREFETTVTEANRALAAGDDARGADLLRSGLAMWRGPALGDVRQGGALRAEALRLDEVRLAALEARIGAELRLGAHTRLVSELTALTSLYPLQENLHAHLIVALYRSGRASRALEVFRRLRSTYVRELGIEPSRRLQELHQAVLGCDPTLDPPVPTLVPV
ncbi:BTAD domain-containing putative transcriptional regulator [Streptomyces sp. NPDC059385]|uniref:AfsR/SARP family transcriptional regulator n=1 Tax=Streptomyces sp. NPDC059385 TaxID=3346817 RepID=UPI003673CCE4